VYGAYSRLAHHYHSVRDSRTSVYFYEKCLELARLTDDRAGEMAANHDLGLIHQSMQDFKVAARYHERHLDLAVTAEASQEENVAARELVKVYRQLAEGHESTEEYTVAVELYQKCLNVARLAVERSAEGLANYRLGRTYVILGEQQKAISYLEDYETICEDLQDREGLGQAHAALAAAYQAMQNDDRALAYLKSCLEVATETENLVAQGEACCSLGVIYNKRAEYDRAVEYFDRNFEIARATVASGRGSTSMVDVSRVYLGMAKGNAMIGQYLHIISHDFRALLSWKTRRQMPVGGKKG